MTGRTKVLLDASNSRQYRARASAAKHAVLKWEGSEYQLSWGTQRFAGPHMLVLDPAGHYGVDLVAFFSTHDPVPDRKDHYVKTVVVRAMCVVEPLELSTVINGAVEMVAQVPRGAYVVQNPTGEQYAMSAEDFFLRYTLLE